MRFLRLSHCVRVFMSSLGAGRAAACRPQAGAGRAWARQIVRRRETIHLRAGQRRCAASASSGRDRLVLGIETSCDDTGAAVVNSRGEVLGEAIAHQYEIHSDWGGVVPALAREAHAAAVRGVVDTALQQAGVSEDDLDAVAVTVGPGLSLCLKEGVLEARRRVRRASRAIPLIDVHHMEAHALVARMERAVGEHGDAGGARGGEAASGGAAARVDALDLPERVQFPFLCLLVSGGHNLLLLTRGVGDHVVLGGTMDDALGEAYDKVARMLGLGMVPSGGAVLEAVARGGDSKKYKFKPPLTKRPGADFSFSGLKTAVRMAIEREGGSFDTGRAETPGGASLPDAVKADIAASFQDVAVRHLVKRVGVGIQWGLEEEPSCRHLVVAGGVAANQVVRVALAECAAGSGLELVCPPPRYCTDNGVMVAWAGMERLRLGLVEPGAAALPEEPSPGEDEWVDLRPRWPLGQRHPRADEALSMRKVRSYKKTKQFTDLSTLTRQVSTQAGQAS
ncbi:unnamed protein product [Pedinophyceae sp. YPF-701]|nr:unnamed protein product [Pedinophyceae sp. YPF-701]